MRVANWNPKANDAEIYGNAMNRIEAAGRVVANDAKRRVRVKSGETQKSIRVVRQKGDSNKNIRVYSKNIYLEYGTVHMKASPFLRPALNANGGKIKNIIENGE